MGATKRIDRVRIQGVLAIHTQAYALLIAIGDLARAALALRSVKSEAALMKVDTCLAYFDAHRGVLPSAATRACARQRHVSRSSRTRSGAPRSTSTSCGLRVPGSWKCFVARPGAPPFDTSRELLAYERGSTVRCARRRYGRCEPSTQQAYRTPSRAT